MIELLPSFSIALPQIRDAHLRALRGALLAAGERLAPTAVSAVADTLRDTMRAAAGKKRMRSSLFAKVHDLEFSSKSKAIPLYNAAGRVDGP